MAGLITGGSIIGGELILGLSDGSILNLGLVQGPIGMKGEPGQPGPSGLDGADGLNFLNGPGIPDATIGVDGEMFFSTTLTAVFGPKVGGTWGSPVYLKPQGIVSSTGQEYSGKDLKGGSGKRGRAFLMGGGPVISPVTGPPVNPGLDTINGHARPLTAAATPFLIAGDPKGDVMHVLVFAQAATGSWYGEVVATRDANKDTSEVIAWETPMGTTPPKLDFKASIDASNVLELSLTTNVDLTELRGKIIYV